MTMLQSTSTTMFRSSPASTDRVRCWMKNRGLQRLLLTGFAEVSTQSLLHQLTKRTFEMITFYFLGWASLEELEAQIKKLKPSED